MAEYLGKGRQKDFSPPVHDNGVGVGNGKRLQRKNLRSWRRNGMVSIGAKNQIGGGQPNGANRVPPLSIILGYMESV